MTPTDPDRDKTANDDAQDDAPVEQARAVAVEEPNDSGEGADNAESTQLDLDVQITSPSACERHITVTISRKDVDRYFDDALSELMPKANVPGFRPGRAPRKLVENRFREEVTDQIKGSLLLDSMNQITETSDLSAISEPDFDFDAVTVPKEGPMTFEFDLEVRPEFELPKWKGLKLEKPVRTFAEKDVRDYLTRLLGNYGALEPYSGAAEVGDYIVADLSFHFDGSLVSEEKEQTIRIEPVLSFRDGNLADFDTLMAGAKAGDKKTATVTVTEDSDDDHLRGKDVEVTIDVLEIKRMQLPDLNEDYIREVSGFNNEGELLDFAKSNLERQLAYHQNRRVRQQITSLLTESADWELPPDMLRRQSQRELERAIMELRSSGFSDDQVKAQTNILRQNSQEMTATALKEHFILERIAEEENLEASDDDYDQEIQLIAAQSDESPRSVRARIEKRGMMDALRNQIVERMAIELIMSEASFSEVPFEPKRDETSAVDISIAASRQSDIPEAKFGGDSKELPTPADYS